MECLPTPGARLLGVRAVGEEQLHQLRVSLARGLMQRSGGPEPLGLDGGPRLDQAAGGLEFSFAGGNNQRHRPRGFGRFQGRPFLAPTAGCRNQQVERERHQHARKPAARQPDTGREPWAGGSGVQGSS